jgi:RNA polymerase sigma-54 factor
MPFKAELSQTQKQIQRLALNQQMQQSLQILRYGIEDLQDFLKQKQLDNPFIQVKHSVPGRQAIADNQQSFLNQLADCHEQTLTDYLLSQVKLTMRKTYLRGWVIFLIDHLDENGYLRADLTVICQKTKVDRTTLLDALTLLQNLDPPGVGARDLQECILLQIQADLAAPQFAYQIISDFFELFVDHQWQKIAELLKTKVKEVMQVADYVKKLSPAPGAAFGMEKVGYIYPDLIAQLDSPKAEVKLLLTQQSKPEIIFKQKYYEKFAALPDQDVQKFLRQKRIEYTNLLHDLEQRGMTIFRVGQLIVDYQKDFFLKSTHPLKPFLLRDIAQQLNLHESTISRAVNGKYLKCDFGVFELKSFFKRGINETVNGDLSAEEAQAQIKALIAAENPAHPLSDNKIAKLLAKNKIFLSRRTIAKYRDEMQIDSSTKRKKS